MLLRTSPSALAFMPLVPLFARLVAFFAGTYALLHVYVLYYIIETRPWRRTLLPLCRHCCLFPSFFFLSGSGPPARHLFAVLVCSLICRLVFYHLLYIGWSAVLLRVAPSFHWDTGPVQSDFFIWRVHHSSSTCSSAWGSLFPTISDSFEERSLPSNLRPPALPPTLCFLFLCSIYLAWLRFSDHSLCSEYRRRLLRVPPFFSTISAIVLYITPFLPPFPAWTMFIYLSSDTIHTSTRSSHALVSHAPMGPALVPLACFSALPSPLQLSGFFETLSFTSSFTRFALYPSPCAPP